MKKKDQAKKDEKKFPGYPAYPKGDDIFNTDKRALDIDPDDKSKIRPDDKESRDWNEKVYDNELNGEDLDVPGSELDDRNEDIGNEDEENNYYSLGGDNHNDLDENDSERTDK